MKKLFRLFTVSLLTVSLTAATVVCCCIAPAVMAHAHKVSACDHCSSKHSSHASSVPGNCAYQLTSAEIIHGKAVFAAAPAAITHDFWGRHAPRFFLPSVIAGYPRGSPPLLISSVPIYLQIRNLRL